MLRSNEYEMVDQLPAAGESHQSQPSSPSTPDSSNSDSHHSESRRSSLSSILFDQIQDYTAKASEADDFYSNPYFHLVFQRYKGAGTFNKKALSVIGIAAVLLWVGAVLLYSQTSPKQLMSSFTSSQVHIGGLNVTLNEYSPNYNNLTFEEYRKGHYFSYREDIRWLNSRQYVATANGNSGGFYLTRGSNPLFEVRQINNEQFSDVVLQGPQFVYKNNFFQVQDIVLNSNKPATDPETIHVVVTDKIDQWRRLSFAIYWLFNLFLGVYTPIQPPDNLRKLNNPSAPLEGGEVLDKLHFVEFSPNGELIIFGFNHDLYLQDLKSNEITRLTHDGSKHIFNGKPDWVYEEEVLADHKAFWWSPNGENIVFLRLNDTKVQEYEIDYYIKDRTEIGIQYEESDQVKVEDVNRYPIKTSIKYPKPGTANPIASLFNYNTKQKKLEQLKVVDTTLGADYIVYDGIWIDDDHFLTKHTDRASKLMIKLVFVPKVSFNLEKVSQVDASDYNGWIEKQSKVAIIPVKGKQDSMYVDKVVVNQRITLALFESAKSASYSRLLIDTKEWDITSSSPIVYDSIENYVYALSTVKSSMDSHLIGIELIDDKGKIKPITSIEIDATFDVDFSANGQYLNLNYKGPQQPWQKLVNIGEVHSFLADLSEKGEEKETQGIDRFIETLPKINHYEVTEKNLKDTNIPTKNYRTVTVGKNPDNSPINLNMIEILPPNFDPNRSTKYPILVHVYGGPGSQTVDKSFSIDFQDIASATLDIVVLIIDPRGTGGQGWQFESASKDRIGFWEPRDITTVVSEYISVNKDFVDNEKTAIWGWSYGGFTTLKTLEFDAGNTFKFGVAVAPVTNWLFYDSIYTERIMGIPSQSDFYQKYAQVSDYNSFKEIERFLIMHGTSDDNVHLQNLLWLIDKLNINNVENYDVHFFPDSDHSIDYHNSNSVVYDKLFSWLKRAFNGMYDHSI